LTSPHNSELEAALLAAMLVAPDIINDVVAMLPGEAAFWRTNHQHIYRAIVQCAHGGKATDWTTVAAQVEANGNVDECGGRDTLYAYLVSISNMPSSYGFEDYAAVVRDCWQRRQALFVASDLIAQAQDMTLPAPATLTKAAGHLADLAAVVSSKDPRRIEDFVAEAQEASTSGGIGGLGSPWRGLDDITTGWRPGQLIVTAAATSVGKSAFASAIAAHHVDQGVLVFSLEMTGREIAARMICTRAGVDSRLYEQGRLSAQDRAAADEAARNLRGNLWIDDSAAMDVAALRAKASRWVAKHGVSLVIVDYLGLVDEREQGASRAVIVGAISRGLKLMAMDCKVPVLALHQLNRDSAKERREPQLHDLRDSGNVEQDADQVILLHRKDRKEAEGIDIIKVKVAKNRGGPISSLELAFRRKVTRFEELAHDDGRLDQAYGRQGAREY
jgi:replicative DNA helicase